MKKALCLRTCGDGGFFISQVIVSRCLANIWNADRCVTCAKSTHICNVYCVTGNSFRCAHQLLKRFILRKSILNEFVTILWCLFDEFVFGEISNHMLEEEFLEEICRFVCVVLEDKDVVEIKIRDNVRSNLKSEASTFCAPPEP